MNESILFNQFEMARNSTLHLAQDVTEEIADRVPNGLPNSLRWQLGHVYTSVESILFLATTGSNNLPEGYGKLFGFGSKPSEGQGNLPKIEEIISLLSGQLNRVKETFNGRLDEKLSNPLQFGPVQLNSIGEVLAFVTLHEGEHHGRIKALKDILKNA